MVGRADNSVLAEWWRTVDKPLLSALLFLLLCGLMASFAASPAVAERISVPEYHFVIRHAVFFIPCIVVMVGVSFLSPKQVRRI